MSQDTKTVVTKIRNAMKGDWHGVVNLYENQTAQTAKISTTGYTALHVAVADGKEEVVEKLVKQIIKHSIQSSDKQEENTSQNTKKENPLSIQNRKGYTPLHLAASMGNVKMCEIIAPADPDVLKIRNDEGETPLFLAALHGKKDAFSYLNGLIDRKVVDAGMECCRRSNGDTILHCAISGEYFDLAFLILKSYIELANWVNEEGDAPLHVLARTPSAFYSGCEYSLWKTLIYTCLHVEGLPENYSKILEKDKNYPQRYYPCTWVSCFGALWDLTHAVTNCSKSTRKADTENPISEDKGNKSACDDENNDLRPPNCTKSHEFAKILHNAVMLFTCGGNGGVMKIWRMKQKHKWSVQVLDKILDYDKERVYDYEHAGESPLYLDDKDRKYLEKNINTGFEEFEKSEGLKTKLQGTKDTAILEASRHGIKEMVQSILKTFPMAVYDMTKDKRNVVLVALEYKRVEVYKFLLKEYYENEHLLREVDKDGNGELHIAAMMEEGNNEQCPIPGEALQLQREIKWKKFVKDSLHERFVYRYNNDGKTPEQIFTSEHKELAKTGSKWMKKTAESCSVVAAVIATVAFASSTALPGGTNERNGKPNLENHFAFRVFALASLIALSFSVTSLIMFLAILTSRFTEKDFGKSLPMKLLLGLTSLFVSIASMLVSFCAGHFFILQDILQYAALPVYAFTCIPISFFAAAQFPLYVDLIRAIFGSPIGKAKKFRHDKRD